MAFKDTTDRGVPWVPDTILDMQLERFAIMSWSSARQWMGSTALIIVGCSSTVEVGPQGGGGEAITSSDSGAGGSGGGQLAEECRAEWPAQSVNAIAAEPAGGVVVGLDYRRVVKLDATCSEVWSKTLPDEHSLEALSVAADGHMVLGGNLAVNGRFGSAGFVSRVDPGGELVWTQELTAPVVDVVVAADGTVFATSNAGLARLDDATFAWEVSLDSSDMGVALGAGETLYVAGACKADLPEQGCGLPGGVGGLFIARVDTETGEAEWSHTFTHEGAFYPHMTGSSYGFRKPALPPRLAARPFWWGSSAAKWTSAPAASDAPVQLESGIRALPVAMT